MFLLEDRGSVADAEDSVRAAFEARSTPESSVGDILVVDDNPANLLAIEAALTGFGGRLVKVGSGADALRALLVQDFALVLLDVQMPGMDGFETARLIRSRERSRHVPIIFVTAYNKDDADMLRGYALGAVDFLFKPITAEVLQAKAAVFVALQRHTAEVARQAELLREHERRDHESRLEEEKRKWEEERLRQQMQEQTRAAQELARINLRLEETDKRKDEFIAILGHELRNPLAPILNGLAVLSAQLPDDPALLRTRQAMERQARHLARLVDDLLDVSRITSGKIELRREALQIGPILEGAAAMSQPSIEEKKHLLALDIEDPGLAVMGDSVRLTQVVANLLNNAARYTPEGGRIRLSCKREGESAVIRVVDNGQGIAPELADSVFDMFVQATPGGGGLGIGLTLVNRLVAMHNGTVSVTSDGPGKGSEFTVRLPVARVDAAKARGATATHAVQVAPGELRIVVVEDNDDIRETLCDLLQLWGHSVETAVNGELGVDLVLKTRPDVALVDIGMPVLDGYGFAEKVRKRLSRESLHLIAMTGFGQKEARTRALDVGFDAHLIKPVDAASLRRALDEVRVRRGPKKR